MQKLRIEIISIISSSGSYGCVRPVCSCRSPKVLGRPPATEPVPGLWILNQPIDRPVKVLILDQVDPFLLCELHLLLQHMCVVCGNIYVAVVLEDALDHISRNIIEHRDGFGLTNSIDQTKMFLHSKEN
jgi:hypothetical protein